MDVSWLTVLLSTVVFISTVLLAVFCLDCRNKSPLASISQTTASEEHVPTSGFMIIHSSQPHPDQNSIRSPSSLLPPHPNSDRPTRPYTPTDTESNPSYENPVPGTDVDNDPEDNGYVIVIPEPDPAPDNPSRASTPCSDVSTDMSTDHAYVNIENELKPETDSESESNYLNVEDMHHHKRSTPDASSRSEDDDDDEGNYVNQVPMIHS